MASTAEVRVALTPDMLDAVSKAVEAGEYASTSDVLRDALSDWMRNRDLPLETTAELGRIWRHALENEHPAVSAEEVLERLENKYRSLAEKTSTSA